MLAIQQKALLLAWLRILSALQSVREYMLKLLVRSSFLQQ
nr:MAG TPA: hypothetical protein [Bacteriophage sp.]